MGYCMYSEESTFEIKEENLDPAFKHCKKMLVKENVKYAWVDNQTLRDSKNLFEFLEECRWCYDLEDKTIGFIGEKYGNEEILFNTLAPFVEDNSYIKMVGEDGGLWKWIFKNGECKKIEPKIIWEE